MENRTLEQRVDSYCHTFQEQGIEYDKGYITEQIKSQYPGEDFVFGDGSIGVKYHEIFPMRDTTDTELVD